MPTLVQLRRKFIDRLQATDGDRRKQVIELEEKVNNLKERITSLEVIKREDKL